VKRAIVVLLALGACAGGQSGDPELAGDRAYVAGKFTEAAAAYDVALGQHADGRLWAKDGAAALRAGLLSRAAEAYIRLGTEDPTRVDDAADGLERVAHAADLAGEGAALRQALLALRHLAPARPALRYSLAVARGGDMAPPDGILVLPQALAAADGPRTVDSLLVRYGLALQETAACEDAADVFRIVLRRSSDSALRRPALNGLTVCSLRLGVAALAAGRPDAAEHWFGVVSSMDSASWIGRRALLGLGDARRARGDTVAAIAAFRAAIALGDLKDSLSQLASGRLDSLGVPLSAGDSARTGNQ
jgi:tetratricopeptide (TPR) repeat protein